MWWCANKDPSIFPLMASLRTHEDWLRQKRTKFHYFHWCHWLHIFISFWINFYTLERTHVPIYAITQEYYHHRFLSFLVFLTTIAVQDCQAISVHYGLSNAIIRDQNFAKVCKSKTLFLAHCNVWIFLYETLIISFKFNHKYSHAFLPLMKYVRNMKTWAKGLGETGAIARFSF